MRLIYLNENTLQLTVAVGNLIVIFVIGSGLLTNQTLEFLVFAIFMFIDMIIFMFIGYLYKPIPLENLEELEEEEK